MGSVEADELRHDQANSARADASAGHLSDALDDVVERVMQLERVPKRGFPAIDVQDFLDAQSDLAELLVQYWGDFDRFKDEIERRLRAHLQDSEIVLDRAEEFANEPDEQS